MCDIIRQLRLGSIMYVGGFNAFWIFSKLDLVGPLNFPEEKYKNMQRYNFLESL